MNKIYAVDIVKEDKPNFQIIVRITYKNNIAISTDEYIKHKTIDFLEKEREQMFELIRPALFDKVCKAYFIK
jgi:hypothetical protein